jgi:hypothetical protein
MAIEEMTQLQTPTSEQRIALSIGELEARLRGLVHAESKRFDMTFFWDLVIGIGVFAAAVVCFVYRVPVVGHPLALLAGPVIGLVLSLKHRPPR